MIADPVRYITSKWWTFVLRGVVALALAALAFAAPSAMAGALVFVVAAYFIISGLFVFLAGLSFSGMGNWWALILLGTVQVALGIIMLAKPGAGPLALAYLFAIWAFSTGLMEISAAIALRSYVKNEFWWVLLGLLTLAFGVYIVLQPALGVLTLVFVIGFYAALAGISLIAVGIRIKGAANEIERQTTAVRQALGNAHQ